MKIAYFVSNRNAFPPRRDQIAASTDVVISIIESLRQKHEVTLYAAEGSKQEGVKIVDLGRKPFLLDSGITGNDWVTKAVVGMKQIYVGEIFKDAAQYDLIHLHTDPIYLGMPFTSLINTPVLFTTHSPYRELEKEIYTYYDGKVYLSAISKSQAAKFPTKTAIPVVYNGVDIKEFSFQASPKGYFLFLGRLIAEKGIEDFLELAGQCEQGEFYIAGKGDRRCTELVEKAAKEKKNIKFFGMVEKGSPPWFDLLGQAKAIIMPVRWDEPFGLAPVEAMACGTPVIAYNQGSMPELVQDGLNGLLAKDQKVSGLSEALKTLGALSESEYQKMRQAARRTVESNFTTEKMAQNYERLYQKIIEDFAKKHNSKEK